MAVVGIDEEVVVLIFFVGVREESTTGFCVEVALEDCVEGLIVGMVRVGSMERFPGTLLLGSKLGSTVVAITVGSVVSVVLLGIKEDTLGIFVGCFTGALFGFMEVDSRIRTQRFSSSVKILPTSISSSVFSKMFSLTSIKEFLRRRGCRILPRAVRTC